MKDESKILRDGWRDFRKIADNLQDYIDNAIADLNEMGEATNIHNIIKTIKITVNPKIVDYVNICHACEIAERRRETTLDSMCNVCPIESAACNSSASYYKLLQRRLF
jgi:uncharacterized protein YeeX (DUF496 family)